MSESILSIKNVSKYFGKVKVVDNLSFDVKQGEIVGFLGPNGAGKTTTIKMILGLLSIDEGSISINGYDIKKNFEKAMQYIGGIVENPDMYGYMSAVDNLKLYAKIRNVDYSKVYKTLELVGLQKSMKHYTRNRYGLFQTNTTVELRYPEIKESDWPKRNMLQFWMQMTGGHQTK